ncbi:MAG: septum site-determining protein MinC [Rhodoferax sp.]|nr:septum site-determining protein MinC [Rhodoferax sp.]
MAVFSADPLSGSHPASFDIKSAQLPLVAMVLKSADWSLVQQELLQAYGPGSESADFFDHDGVVIDFSLLSQLLAPPPWETLLATLRSCRLQPVAVRGADATCTESASEQGLVEAPAEVHRPVKASKSVDAEVVVQEVVKEVVREVPGPTTMVVDKPLRSGQKIYARGGDLVVLAMVNQGAEIAADGNIHVYAPLRGKAMAGARGNTQARIFSLCLEPELVSIAGVYRTSENAFPKDVHGKAAQVRLSNDGQEKLLIEPLKA